MDQVARRVGAVIDNPETLRGSMSGSRVVAVTRVDGSRAVLKVTIATDGWDRNAAERELDCYQRMRGRFPIKMPDLLDFDRTPEAVALLLSAHRPSPAAQEWTYDQWLALAGDLARLHETPIPTGWWVHPDPEPTEAEVTRARDYWLVPSPEPTPRPESPTPRPELVEGRNLIAALLEDPDQLHRAMLEFPSCFLHGDCHTANILIEGDELIWTDWQVTCVGYPAAELAFPSVRATESGAELPLSEMIAGYARHRGLDATALERAVLAAELRCFLLVWPEYAGFNSAVGIERVHRRVTELAQAWRRRR
jgi:hypothetical protein